MKLKNKIRAINKPDLPFHLDILEIDKVMDGSSYEMGKLESTNGTMNAKNVRFSEVHIKGVNFGEGQLPFSTWLDVIFEKCDLSNVKLKGARFNRVEFRECKLVGVDFDEAIMRDVQFIDCPAPYSLFNLTDLGDVRFDDCLLKEANFIEATFDNVQFGASAIQEVQFSDTSLRNVDLSQCQFTFIHVKEDDLRGAIISPEQAITLIEVFGLEVKHD
ncbi:pentapeptide repeat-containing protein [Bacillus sp. NEB1478]|uniref:pentapeptide repeat-containing protein n=1 Tax=Bacillus sp. NEB1478 TaxID=3073816 RepID=UPI002873262A|nr:pentapeptide repeat-containing protein [Bacillus sp. NEB1478]WNB93814.1 pentapeptide repeat-containing protein [Bacillus sp. NEB1478]